MDDFDLKLLQALQEDGRLTNNDLADRVGLSASQCSRRRAALENAGVIEGYQAVLSPAALGLAVLAFVHVTLATHSPGTPSASPRTIDRTEGGAGSLFADRRGRLPGQDRGSRPQGAVAHSQRGVLAHGSVAHVHSAIVPRSPQKIARLPLAHLRAGLEEQSQNAAEKTGELRRNWRPKRRDARSLATFLRFESSKSSINLVLRARSCARLET
jgi:DNA-binding Lrp family transcriptional regulator